MAPKYYDNYGKILKSYGNSFGIAFDRLFCEHNAYNSTLVKFMAGASQFYVLKVVLQIFSTNKRVKTKMVHGIVPPLGVVTRLSLVINRKDAKYPKKIIY